MNSNNCRQDISGKLKEIGSTIALMDEGVFNDTENYKIFHDVNEVLLKMVKASSSKQNESVIELHQYDLIKKIGLREFLDIFTREVVKKSLEENKYKVRNAIKELKIATATFYRYYDKETPATLSTLHKVGEYEHELQ